MSIGGIGADAGCSPGRNPRVWYRMPGNQPSSRQSPGVARHEDRVTDKADPFEPTRLAVASDGEHTRVPLSPSPASDAPASGGSPASGPAPVWTGPGSA